MPTTTFILSLFPNKTTTTTMKQFLSILTLIVLWAPAWAFQAQIVPTNPPSTSSLKMSVNPSEGTYTPRRLVIVGGGLGGLSSAFDARHLLRPQDEIIVVSDRPEFSFTPSNPWVSVRIRKPEDIQLPLADVLPRHNIQFVQGRVAKLQPEAKKLRLEGGSSVDYDYLIIATGPRLASEVVPGLKEEGLSVCTTPHASHAADVFDKLVESPGPIVVGATQGASCFGPAYEYALLLKHEMKRRGGNKLVEQCPMTFVTAEPYVGHLGLNGAGTSKEILLDLLEQHKIDVYANTRTTKVTKDSVHIEKLDEEGNVTEEKTIPSSLTMFVPPFHGYDVWKSVPDLTDEVGMIKVNDHQQSTAYPDIFGVGICVKLSFKDKVTIPIGAPKTGYMIESMGTAAVKNIRTMIDWQETHDPHHEEYPPLHSKAIMNGLCITDFGDDGAIFVTMPQIPPRRHDWTIHSKLATLAKIAFEKYFLHKITSGDTDPYYEKYMLKLIGVERTEEEKAADRERLGLSKGNVKAK